MTKVRESFFQKKVLKELRLLSNSFVFTKEAKAIRGLPDVMACINGIFIGLELKKDLASTRVKTGRIVLQKYNIDKINKAGGFARLSCPETFEQDLIDLIEFSTS